MSENAVVKGNKKFSVVIPLYNKGAHIASTLNSVLAQSFRDFEIIVIDDGSTDSSFQQVMLLQNSTVQIIQQSNQGVSVARNRGIQESSGDYIAFLDADDHWFPWHLEELNNLITRYPGHGVYSVAHEIYREGKTYIPTQPLASDFAGYVPDFFGAFSKSLALVNSTTACLPRDLLLRIGGFPEKVKKGEDVYVWLKAALEKGLVYSARICARYNQDAQCRSNRQSNGEIPYYLIWLDDLISLDALEKNHLKGAGRFLFTGVFFNAAGMRLEGHESAFLNMKKLNISKLVQLKLLLFLLQLTPRYILKVAQRYRHPQA